MTARWSRALALALVLSFAIRAGRLALSQSVTVDEYAHLPCGLSHVVHGDFAMLPWPPPLAQTLLSLPALTLEPVVPHGAADEWEAGRAFEAANRGRYHAMFVRSRVLAVALGVALLGCIHAWSRRLWGEPAALIPLAVASLEPNLITHSSLVTTDIALTLVTVLALWSAARLIDAPDRRAVVLTGVAFGAALLTKLTALILIPVAGLTALVSAKSRLRTTVRAVLAGFVALGVINLGYGFRGSLGPLDGVSFRTHAGRTLQRLDLRLPVPLPLLRAIDYHRALTRRGWPSYLNGRLMNDAPWYYVPVALAMKSTVGFLLLAVVTLPLAVAGLRRRSSGGVVLVLLGAAAYLFAGMRSPVNDGVRHVLPLYALIAIASGSLASRFPRVALALVTVHGAESVAASGGELAFFNLPTRAIAVAADHGVYPLLGSAVDIGQDLPALRELLDGRGITGKIHLAYSGRVDPRIYGIDYTLPREPFEAGWYAVSVTHLRGLRYLLLDPESETRRFARPSEFSWFRGQEPVARAGASILLYRVGDGDGAITSGHPEPPR